MTTPTREEIHQSIDEANRATRELGKAIEAGSGDIDGLLSRASTLSSIVAEKVLTFSRAAARSAEGLPLDPSKVKAGDTVTLEDRRSNMHDDSITPDPDWRLTGKVRDIHVTHSDERGTPYAWSVRIGHSPYHMGTAEWAYTLTAHQPAPEPEREPGTSGTATVEGKAGVQGTWVRSLNGEDYFATHHAETSTGNLAHSDQVTDFVPDVVLDPAAARSAIVSALGEMTGLTTWTQGGGLTTRSCRLVLDRVTSALGIEAP
jgi:hypothetical protein